MEFDTIIDITLKTIILLTIVYVWIIHVNSPSAYRGGGADSMIEEFQNYGFSPAIMYLVGFLKIAFATILFLSIFFYPVLFEQIGALGIAVLMLGAIFMHMKIGDPMKRSLPAFTMLVLSVLTLFV